MDAPYVGRKRPREDGNVSMPDAAAMGRQGPRERLALGWLLSAMGWLTTFAAGLLAPVLPQMVRQFASAPHVQVRVSLVATAPALAVALVAVATGLLGDRFGHRRILLLGLGLYTIAGTAPVLMNSLDAIIVSRFVMGLGEASAMAMSTALIALSFEPAPRARWLSFQVVSANVVGLVILLCGGLVGRLSWRAPFLVYALPLVLLWLAIGYVRQPPYRPAQGTVADRWTPRQIRVVAGSCLLQIFATMSIGVLIVDFPFLFDERGVKDPGAVGLLVGICALGVTLGAALGRTMIRLGTTVAQLASLALIAVGFELASLATAPGPTAAWGLVTGLGVGTLIPPLLDFTMGSAPRRAVGSVGGLWTTSIFVGQFAGPICILALRSLVGTLDAAIGSMSGVACGVGICVVLASWSRASAEA